MSSLATIPVNTNDGTGSLRFTPSEAIQSIFNTTLKEQNTNIDLVSFQFF